MEIIPYTLRRKETPNQIKLDHKIKSWYRLVMVLGVVLISLLISFFSGLYNSIRAITDNFQTLSVQGVLTTVKLDILMFFIWAFVLGIAITLGEALINFNYAVLIKLDEREIQLGTTTVKIDDSSLIHIDYLPFDQKDDYYKVTLQTDGEEDTELQLTKYKSIDQNVVETIAEELFLPIIYEMLDVRYRGYFINSNSSSLKGNTSGEHTVLFLPSEPWMTFTTVILVVLAALGFFTLFMWGMYFYIKNSLNLRLKFINSLPGYFWFFMVCASVGYFMVLTMYSIYRNNERKKECAIEIDTVERTMEFRGITIKITDIAEVEVEELLDGWFIIAIRMMPENTRQRYTLPVAFESRGQAEFVRDRVFQY